LPLIYPDFSLKIDATKSLDPLSDELPEGGLSQGSHRTSSFRTERAKGTKRQRG
jgi:hypothetical protein